MNVQRIDNFEQFLSMREEWNALLQSSKSNCVFLTHEWLSSWWKHLADGRRLSIVAAHDDGELVGIFPVAERAAQYARMMPRVLEFLGSGVIGSDYLDMIIKGGRETQVIAAFAEYLCERGLMLQLTQLRRADCLSYLLAELLLESGWTVKETKQNICPYINLTGHTWETYLAALGPNIRKNINRYLRNLPKTYDVRMDCVQSACEAESALDIVIDLHRKRWELAGTSEAFQSGSVVAFHREFVQLAATRGWLRVLILRLDGEPAASLYGLRYGPAFNFYQSGFNPAFSKHSVGVATMGVAIQTAIEEGAQEYDFLHGDEEYKFHWASGTRELGRLELDPPHTKARIYRQAIELNRAARRMARRVLSKA